MRFAKLLFFSTSLVGSLSQAQLSLPRTVFQFPNPTWVENIHAMRNGSLLASISGRPELHLLNPFGSMEPVETLLYSFPGANTVAGITEYEPDVFVVATGNYSVTDGAQIGSSSAWKVDLRHTGPKNKKVTKITDLPRADFINGMAAVNDHIILMADSAGGSIVKFNVKKGTYKVGSIQHPTLACDPSGAVPFGVNGMKIVDSTLYFTNSQLGILNKVDIDLRTGHPISPFTVIANLTVPDDLAVTDDGNAFVARPYANILERVTDDGQVVIFAGGQDSLAVAGVTSATLGRTWKDRGVIYVATTGGSDENGGFLEGGKIVALSLTSEARSP